MSDDPIVAETRAARERLVARFGGDLDALWRHIHEVEQTLKDRIVRREPKKPEPTARKVS
jgi:hypothetical protein